MRPSLLLAALLASSTALAQPAPPPGDGPPPGPMTLKQFQDEQVARFMMADTDHDGRVSKAELEARMQPPPGQPSTRLGGMGGRGIPSADAHEHRFDPDGMFARLDTNGDGYITPDEVAAHAAERFQRLDRNGDGVLTPDEMPRWGEHRSPPGAPPPPPPGQ